METALSTGGLRPRVVVVWVLLLALLGTIAAVELTDRRRQPAESQAQARERMLLPLPVEQLGAIELAHAGTLHRFERDAARFTPQACRDNALRFDRAAFRRRFAEVLREAQAA